MAGKIEKKNKKGTEALVRLIVLIIFVLLAEIIAFIFFVVVLINIFITLFSGKPNKALINFSMAGFNEIVRLCKYLLFISDERPFPLNELMTGPQNNKDR